VKDFWTWLHRSLSSKVSDIIPSGTSLVFNKITAAGEGAVGYLAIQSSFLSPEARIELVMAQYAKITVGNPDYNPGPYILPSFESYVDTLHLKY
jgi:hypothetical protein